MGFRLKVDARMLTDEARRLVQIKSNSVASDEIGRESPRVRVPDPMIKGSTDERKAGLELPIRALDRDVGIGSPVLLGKVLGKV